MKDNSLPKEDFSNFVCLCNGKGGFNAPSLSTASSELYLAAIAMTNSLSIRLALGHHFSDASIEGSALLLQGTQAQGNRG